jgi:hypothetical protein
MTKIDYTKAIKESAEELRKLEKEQGKAFVRDRIASSTTLVKWKSSFAAC